MLVGDLFSGVGGFSLAAEWMGWETAWFSEIDPYASAVLKKHWPDVPNLGDITRVEWSTVPAVDVLCGGFPCQDISNAGKRIGITGERSGLWKEYARAIRVLRPRFVVVENVRALLGRGIDVVLGDLSDLGYDAEWQVLSASDVGAPHKRERVWIVANTNGQREQQSSGHQSKGGRRASDSGEAIAMANTNGTRPAHDSERITRRHTASDRNSPLPNTERERLEGIEQSGAASRSIDRPGNGCDPAWWATEPDVGRVAHGVPARVDRLRCLGNSIVPHCALEIFKAIEQREASRLAA